MEEKDAGLLDLKETLVTIDDSVEFQIIDGFGAFGAKTPFWFEGPFYDDELIDKLVNDLGLTILRTGFPDGFDPLKGNYDDGSTIEFAGINNTVPLTGTKDKVLPYLRRMKAAGVEKFIVSNWAPPAWMKTNNDIANGGALKAECYKDYAKHWAIYIKYVKEQCDIDIYAVSLQNEPAFVEPYSSCVYTPEQFKDLIITAGKVFEEEGIKTKIFMPEDIGYYPRVMEYINTVLNDEEARKYADIVAVHGYALDGITADSPDAKTWKSMYEAGAKYDKPLWMTETSGYQNNWEGASKLAKAIYIALKYGKISAWVWWQVSDLERSSQFAVMIDGIPTSRYYVSKNYYRYIRPGAVHIDSKSSDAEVLSISFKHELENTLTTVLINAGTEAKKVVLQGNVLPKEFDVYRTSESENCCNLGKVKGSDIIILPPDSITTVYGKFSSN